MLSPLPCIFHHIPYACLVWPNCLHSTVLHSNRQNYIRHSSLSPRASLHRAPSHSSQKRTDLPTFLLHSMAFRIQQGVFPAVFIVWPYPLRFTIKFVSAQHHPLSFMHTTSHQPKATFRLLCQYKFQCLCVFHAREIIGLFILLLFTNSLLNFL